MDERDRDESGRARNARPRDGLGRPLPYGATGVQRAPEGALRTARQTVTEAQALLTAGRPFHAHEVFEDAWKSAQDADRALWQGLAQLAVGLTHAARGNPVGAATLLRRGARAIGPYRDSAPFGINVAGLERWADSAAEAIESSGSVPAPPVLIRDSG